MSIMTEITIMRETVVAFMMYSDMSVIFAFISYCFLFFFGCNEICSFIGQRATVYTPLHHQSRSIDSFIPEAYCDFICSCPSAQTEKLYTFLPFKIKMLLCI